jgi:hypothetical protein
MHSEKEIKAMLGKLGEEERAIMARRKELIARLRVSRLVPIRASLCSDILAYTEGPMPAEISSMDAYNRGFIYDKDGNILGYLYVETAYCPGEICTYGVMVELGSIGLEHILPWHINMTLHSAFVEAAHICLVEHERQRRMERV